MSLFKQIFTTTKGTIGGIDLGTQNIKFVQLNKTTAEYQLVKLAVFPTSPMAIKDGDIVDPGHLSTEIKQQLQNHNIDVNKVVTSVSGSSVVMRPITMTQMTEKELQNAIKFEAERYLPYAVADASVRGTILRKSISGDEKNMEVLLVAAPQSMVNSVSKAMKLTGLEVEAIDLEPFCILRTLQNSLDPETFSKTIALINLGATTSSINIFKNGILRHNRTIGLAGNNFTKAIGQSLNLSFDEAEKIKKDKGAIRLEDDAAPVAPTTMRIFNVITPVLSELITEIQRSFDYYRSRYKGESVDLIILSGGTAKFKNLEAFIKKELQIECKVADVLKNISCEKVENITPEELKELSPSLIVALGLAMREHV